MKNDNKKKEQNAKKIILLLLFGIIILFFIDIIFAFEGLGNGTINNPYQVTNCSLLQSMNESLISYYVLMNDIDCSGILFNPISLSSTFYGGLDGKGYNIINLTISKDGSNRVGLFSDFEGVLKNTNIINANVTANYDVGVLVGYLRGGNITNCSVRNSIILGTSGTGNIGGLVGRSFGVILNSFVFNSLIIGSSVSVQNVGGFVGLTSTSSNVSSSGIINSIILANGSGVTNIGGFVGRAESPFFDSYASNITINAGGSYVGGFCGYGATTTSTIRRCWSSGVILSGGVYTGGFIGRVTANITDCYSWVNVTSSADYIGGFCGYSSSSSCGIENSYSIGKVIRNASGSYMGGFIGRNIGVLTNVFYDNETSGQNDSGKGIGKLSYQMKQNITFINWDFLTPIWYIIENQTYPSLNVFEEVYPSSPIVYSPVTFYYMGLFSINYTSSIFPNEVSFYNITLLNLNFSYNQTITSNNSNNLGYIYNSSLVADGFYIIKVTACDINSKCSSGFSEYFGIDNTAPFGNLINPTNNSITTNMTFNFSVQAMDNVSLGNLTLNIRYSNGTLVYNESIITNETSGVFGIVYEFLYIGIYEWFYTIYDVAGNFFQTVFYSLSIFPNEVIISIIFPINDTDYSYFINHLDYSTSNAESCWYSLDEGITNISLNCEGNSIEGILSQDGMNIWSVYANNSIGNISYQQVIFNSTCSNVLDPLVTLVSYPYVEVNTSYPIIVSSFPSGASNIQLKLIDPNNSISYYNMIYDNVSNYELTLNFIDVGNYVFEIFGDNICPSISSNITGTLFVREPYYIEICGYNDKTGTLYKNNFAYLTAEFVRPRYNFNLEQFITPLGFKYTFKTPVFHTNYVNGCGTLKLYDANESYIFRIFDGQVSFASQYSPPNMTKSYGTNILIDQMKLNGTSQNLSVFLSEKDIRPYFWLMNILFIIGIILVLIISIFMFFVLTDRPSFVLIFFIIGIVGLIIARIIIYFYLG